MPTHFAHEPSYISDTEHTPIFNDIKDDLHDEFQIDKLDHFTNEQAANDLKNRVEL